MSDYIGVLRQVELWGSSTPLEFLAASEIRSRMSYACADVKHNCDTDLNCPLKIQIGVVGDKLQRLLDNCIGLSLGDSEYEGVCGVYEITQQDRHPCLPHCCEGGLCQIVTVFAHSRYCVLTSIAFRLGSRA